ncbi:ring finger protein 146 [Aphomia sociella]
MHTDNQAADQDCAVCLQKCHHPTQLPCGHVFCFLCVKGIAIQSKKCAMCRANIPPDYLDHPVLLEDLSAALQSTQPVTGEYQWFYEGRNGWWKYDERSNSELETAFSDGETECTLLIAGALYNIDFQNMVQVRRSDPTRRRLVRRDHSTLPAKGIAGIKTIDSRQIEQSKRSSEDNISEATSNQEIENEIIEITDNEDEGQSYNNDEDHQDNTSDIIHRFSTINLDEPESPVNLSTTEDI